MVRFFRIVFVVIVLVCFVGGVRGDALRFESSRFRVDTLSGLDGGVPVMLDGTVVEVEVSGMFIVDTGGLAVGYDEDSDGDGLPDWWEVEHGLDPGVSDALQDPDGDGLGNGDEFRLGFLPLVRDWVLGAGEGSGSLGAGVSGVFVVDTGGPRGDLNGDGLPDWWGELFFGEGVAVSAGGDFDGDGFSNGAEFVARTDPTDAGDLLRVVGLERMGDGGVVVEWRSRPGRVYGLVLWGDGLGVGEGVSGGVVSASGLVSRARVFEGGGGSGFLRVVVVEEE